MTYEVLLGQVVHNTLTELALEVRSTHSQEDQYFDELNALGWVG